MLVEVNVQLCNFLFTNSEFQTALSEVYKNLVNNLTSAIFPDNKLPKRLSIKIEALPVHREKAFNTLLGMSRITSSEYLFNYIEEIENYRSIVSPIPYDSTTDN